MNRVALLSALAAGTLVLSFSFSATASPMDSTDGASTIKSRGQSQALTPGIGAKPSGGVTANEFPGCGVRVDLPHSSSYTHYQMHTNANSTCYVVPVISSSLKDMYRERWALALLAPVGRTVTGPTGRATTTEMQW